MSEGWVKLHRKLIKWEWYKDSNMLHLFIHLLISANHKPGKWRGINIKRGQLITGRKSLSEQTGLSLQTIRTCLNRLKSTTEITIKSTNKYSVITICNYDDYQIKENDNNHLTSQQLTNNQPTTNQQLTTNKNEKKEKNVNKYAFNEFYDNQLKLSNDDKTYKQFLEILFGKNKTGKQLNGVLSIPEQLTFEQFGKCLKKANETGKKISEAIEGINNDKKYYKGKKSLIYYCKTHG